jgi:hypothetical protein
MGRIVSVSIVSTVQAIRLAEATLGAQRGEQMVQTMLTLLTQTPPFPVIL